MESTPCNVEQINNAFIAAVPDINPIIANKSKMYKAVYRDLIERGNFEYGKGYTKYNETFYGGIAVQDAGASWSQMQQSRAPKTNGSDDAGYDACAYQSEVINYGFEQKSYTIYQATRRTNDICLTDIMFDWQYEKQLALIYQALANVTLGEWEQITRELYLNFCKKFYAQADPSNTTNLGLKTFTMGMFSSTVAIPAAGIGDIGRLTQSVLDRVYSYLSRQAADAALGMKSGSPIFGLITSMETSNEVITKDTEIRKDYRYLQEEYLIQGYGSALTYRGFSHIHDPAAPRLVVNALGTALTRVWPFLESPTTIGNAIDINPAYIAAPFEISAVFLKDVYKALTPTPNPSSLASGYKFDPADNFGEFHWLNIQERCDNLLREKGFFFSRFRIAPEPWIHSNDAICILHRRCNELEITECPTCWTAGSSPIAVSACAQVNASDVAADATEYYLTLASCLPCDVGQMVTVTGTSPSTAVVGVIAEDFAAPIYKIVFPVGVATGRCAAYGGPATVTCGGTRV